MKNIITIQHTQAVHHNNGMAGSWTDWELTDFGKSRAENIGRRLSAKLEGKSCKIFGDIEVYPTNAAKLMRKYNTGVQHFIYREE